MESGAANVLIVQHIGRLCIDPLGDLIYSLQVILTTALPLLRWHNWRFDIAHNPERAFQPADEIRLRIPRRNRLGDWLSALADDLRLGRRSNLFQHLLHG
jgi:hypothetical protein